MIRTIYKVELYCNTRLYWWIMGDMEAKTKLNDLARFSFEDTTENSGDGEMLFSLLFDNEQNAENCQTGMQKLFDEEWEKLLESDKRAES